MKRTHSETVTGFDTLPDSAGVSDQVVADVLGVSRVTVWRWSKSGLLPAPSKRGGATRWSVGALRRAMSATA
jgi:predicted site-specific integrase-resolvase